MSQPLTELEAQWGLRDVGGVTSVAVLFPREKTEPYKRPCNVTPGRNRLMAGSDLRSVCIGLPLYILSLTWLIEHRLILLIYRKL